MTAVSRQFESTSERLAPDDERLMPDDERLTPDDEWLTPDEAASRLGVSLRKLQYLAKSGEVSRRREGRRSYYLVPREHEPPRSATAPIAADDYVESIYRPSQGMSPFPQRPTGSVALAKSTAASRLEKSTASSRLEKSTASSRLEKSTAASGVVGATKDVAANTNRTHDFTMEVEVAPPPVIERVYALEQRVDALAALLEERTRELAAERARVDALQDELDEVLEQESASTAGLNHVDDALMQALLRLPPATQHARVTNVQQALGLQARSDYEPTGAYVTQPPRFPPSNQYDSPAQRTGPPAYDEAPLHVKLEQQRHEAERNEVRDALESALALPELPEPTARERVWEAVSRFALRACDWALGRKPLS